MYKCVVVYAERTAHGTTKIIIIISYYVVAFPSGKGPRFDGAQSIGVVSIVRCCCC
jgi:hypothetical protein